MRRKLSALLCVLLCLLLCACGAAPQETTTAPAAGTSSADVSTTAAITTTAPTTTLPPETTAAPTTTASPTTTAALTTTTAPATTGTTAPPQTTKATTAKAAATTAQTTTRAATRPAQTTTTAPTTRATTAPTTTTQPQTQTCTLSIDCKTLLNHLDALDESKRALVPQNGVLLSARSVTFKAGETVFDVLKRTCRQNGIQMEFSMTPVYGSAYIEGIGNLYEFDGGPLSGWMYSVNGAFPNVGCSSCELHDGDVIVWRYTCNLGDDIGGHNQYQ